VRSKREVEGKSCQTCQWWTCFHMLTWGGECRRFPPIPKAPPRNQDGWAHDVPHTHWHSPLTTHDHHCGEWTPCSKPASRWACPDCHPLQALDEVLSTAPPLLQRKMQVERISTIEELKRYTWIELSIFQGWGGGTLAKMKRWLDERGIVLWGWSRIGKHIQIPRQGDGKEVGEKP